MENTHNDEIEKWKIRFERERKIRKEAEALLEEKSAKLFDINKSLKEKIEKEEEYSNQITSLLEQFDKNIIASRTNLDGVITHASKAFQKISGYEEYDLIGKTHNILRHPDMPKSFFKKLWDTIKKGNTWEGEIKNKRKDGSYYWVNVHIEPYYKNGEHIGYSSIKQEITDKKKLENSNNTLENKVKERTKEIENKLFYDDLTGLKSDYALIQDLDSCDKIFSSLFLINIDSFQNVNNLYGYKLGNEVLKQFAQVLKKFDSKNKIYRSYADEFAIIKNYTSLNMDEFYKYLLELKKQIASTSFVIKDFDNNLKLDITVGLSIAQDELLSTANMALSYARKHNLSHQVYNSEIDKRADIENTLLWQDRIKRALEDDRVIPVFQPILNRKQEIIKYEVLMRIESNEYEKNLVLPYVFLKPAITLKLNGFLTRRIIEKTFKAMKKSDKQFSINLSFDDIFDNYIMEFLEQKIKQNPEKAKKLVVEILETHEITNLELMNEFLTKMRKYGVKIAIDDFGVGHSNLSQIFKLNPDYLKIDGEFIKNIDKNKESYALVRSVVTFAKELDIKVIAEYVHSKEIFDLLYFLGVDEFQGFYFSAPKRDIED